jgi:hypothetical protein
MEAVRTIRTEVATTAGTISMDKALALDISDLVTDQAVIIGVAVMEVTVIGVAVMEVAVIGVAVMQVAVIGVAVIGVVVMEVAVRGAAVMGAAVMEVAVTIERDITPPDRFCGCEGPLSAAALEMVRSLGG